MNILVACEESQAVVKELRELGHRAFSCDIQECSGGHPEWHIKDDVLPLLNGRCNFYTQDGVYHSQEDRWDMIIAFPPCTHLAISGAPYFEEKRKDGIQEFGIWFFCQFFKADCDKISIENPINIIGGDYVPKWFSKLAEEYDLPKLPTQRIQPWMFGDNFNKTTCLWLKGLKPLVPDTTIKPQMEWKEWIDKNGKKKRESKWLFDAFCNCKTPEERRKVRSKTFKGIVHAMATQWTKE